MMRATTAIATLAIGALGFAGGFQAYAGDMHRAEGPAPHVKNAMVLSKAAVGREVARHRLTDSGSGQTDLWRFRGRPLLVNLIYTSCDHTCPMITTHLARAADVAWEALGPDSFAVVTIGFDVRHDSPQRMRAYGKQHGIDLPNWRFLSGDAATIEALTKELGFSYRPSPHGFDHIAQVSLIDAQGRVFRQIYGEAFDPPTVVEPLKRVIYGRRADATSLAGWINGVRLFCTVYDPSSERYRFDYSLFVAFAVGVACLGGVAVFLGRAWYQSWRSSAGGRKVWR